MISMGTRVIDADYRGNIVVLLFNHSDQPFQVKTGDKITQLIVERIHNLTTIPVQSLTNTDRGSKGFSSIDSTILTTIIENPKEQIPLIAQHHNSPLAGHPSIAKTLELLSQNYSWPNIRQDVEEYVKGCIPCQMNKPHRQKPHAPLHPVDPGPSPFQNISLDLIAPLSISNSYNAILVIVDKSTKKAVFIPTNTTLTSKDFADLIVHHCI